MISWTAFPGVTFVADEHLIQVRALRVGVGVFAFAVIVST
jgi:hypothetical protein